MIISAGKNMDLLISHLVKNKKNTLLATGIWIIIYIDDLAKVR